jgi:ATP-dependent Clp protease ATP-binding subunit ClpC
MFERFTDRARRVIVLAQEESRQLGHLSIDVGHIGLAALNASDGAGLDDEVVGRLREAMTTTFAGLAVDEGYTGHIPFTPATKEVFERSLRLSLEARRNYINSVDLLMAALADPNINATATAHGIDYDQVHATLMQSVMIPGDFLPSGREGRGVVLPPDQDQTITDQLQEVLKRTGHHHRPTWTRPVADDDESRCSAQG